ncbi:MULTISPECIES: DinB family protein [Aneurinibacillus]
MIDHEVHHKGQLFLYARLIGIEKLPFFITQPPKQENIKTYE